MSIAPSLVGRPAALALLLLAATPLRADDPPPPAPAAHLGERDVATRVRDLIGILGPRATTRSIGTSREGRAIELVILGDPDLARRRPALLLVGGMDGANLASPNQVLASLAAIARESPELLDHVRVYAIPVANPDARAAAFASAHPRPTNAREVDEDRDGGTAEDPPRDVDGDGVVAMMRRIAPPGRAATHVVDATDPRIVRPAKRDKGERATHELFVEGSDLDGDGQIAEDGTAGVDLDRNFPHRWPEFSPDAGPFQLSEPESLAIATFVRAHPEITTAVVFGRHDVLANFPDVRDMDPTGRTPMVYLEDDHPLYREFSQLWKESTKLEKSANADLSGSLVLWLANHRGIAAVAANGWHRPEPPSPPEGTPPPPETGDPEQSAWLAVSDSLRGGRGFVAWKPFAHPTLGQVEIGGFAPFLRESPTAAEAEEIALKSAAFVKALAARRPVVATSELRIEPLADGLARLSLRILNDGTLPTTTAMGVRTDRVPPIVVRLSTTPEDVLSGRRVEKIERLAPGEARDFTWIVRVAPGAASVATITGPTFDPIVRAAEGAAR